MNIYMAGPLFSQAEIEYNLRIYHELTKHQYQVFLPQLECQGLELKDIFAKCKQGIDISDVILANLDGADADSGTCWECGYGYALKKHIIAIRTDFRQNGDTKGFNAMLYFSAHKLIESANPLNDILSHLHTLKNA